MPDPSENQNLYDVLKKQNPQWVNAPLRRVDFQRDTLPFKEAFFDAAGAMYAPINNTITVYVKKNYDGTYTTNSQAELAHEQKHRDNQLAGLYSYNMSLEQRDKIECIDEVSANICELLQWREQYINAKDDTERQAIINHEGTQRFDYYFNAIKEGKINPLSHNTQDVKEEMRFIGKETQDMWMDRYAQRYYKQRLPKLRKWFDSHNYDELRPNESNYQIARKIALGNIGGVDFTEYTDDIKSDRLNIDLKFADQMIAARQFRATIREIAIIAYVGERQYPISINLQQTKNLKNATFIGELDSYRENYLKNNRIETDDATIQEWLQAVNQGKFVPQAKMSEEEKQWLETMITKKTRISKEDGYYWGAMGCEDDIRRDMTNGLGNLEYRRLLYRLCNIGGEDFSYCVQFPKDIALAELDTKIANGYKLQEDDFKKGFTPQKLKNFLHKKEYTTLEDMKPDPACNDKRISTSGFNTPVQPEYYTEWSPTYRVSDVQYEEIYDFTKPFLKERMEQAQKNMTLKKTHSTADSIMILRGLRSQEKNGVEQSVSYKQRISVPINKYRDR